MTFVAYKQICSVAQAQLADAVLATWFEIHMYSKPILFRLSGITDSLHLICFLYELQLFIVDSFTKLIQGFFLSNVQPNDIDECILHVRLTFQWCFAILFPSVLVTWHAHGTTLSCAPTRSPRKHLEIISKRMDTTLHPKICQLHTASEKITMQRR